MYPAAHVLLCAGQTGSGKTYTMGSAWSPDEDNQGVIPSVMDELFTRVEHEPHTDFTLKVSFVEIHKVRHTSHPHNSSAPGVRMLGHSCEHARHQADYSSRRSTCKNPGPWDMCTTGRYMQKPLLLPTLPTCRRRCGTCCGPTLPPRGLWSPSASCPQASAWRALASAQSAAGRT